MEILDGVLTYRLINSANLTNVQKQLVNAMVSKMDHQIMKKRSLPLLQLIFITKLKLIKLMLNQKRMNMTSLYF